jgi:magnesium transporter
MHQERPDSAIAELDPVADREAMRRHVIAEHPADLAHRLGELDPDSALDVLDMLSFPRQAEVMNYLEPETRVGIALLLPPDRLAALISEMNADDRADLFAELPADVQELLLTRLRRDEREDIRRLAAYEEETAGALMTTDLVELSANMTVQQAMDSLREQAPDSETIYRAYVVDESRRLLGSLRLQNLIFARRDRLISELMETNTFAVHVHEDQEEVARRIAKYDVLALPVVDSVGRLVGIITHDDAMDVLEEEASEDMYRAGAVVEIEGSVREAPLATLYRKRIVWLILLVFGALFSSAGIAYFEDTIARYVALVFFLPLLIGSAGNAGSQAATLMVRALAIGDVELKDWGLMLGRELAIGAALGVTMGLAVSGIGLWRGGTDVALVVAGTMMVVVVFGSLIGLSLPFLLRMLNVDPATASAPLVATIADVGGVVIYFSIATAVLDMT